MDVWLFGLFIGMLAVVAAAFVWLGWRIQHLQQASRMQLTESAIDKDVDRIFDATFREELRNRGKLHFEKIISENAMFLQQDLRLTAAEMNEHMQKEINRTLQEEFAKYEQSITDAKQIALNSIAKTQEAIEQQRQLLIAELKEQFAQEKVRLIERFEHNMADIINHYMLEAIGDQIDLNDQLDYILQELERNKASIVEDVKRGA